jgi:hypothetical protein
MATTNQLDIFICWQFVGSGQHSIDPRTSKSASELKPMIDDDEYSKDDVNTKMSFRTLTDILHNIVDGSTNSFFIRDEFSYDLNPSQFVTGTTIYGITSTDDTNIDFQKSKQSRINNALKPIKDDDDLSAAINVAKRIYEVTPEQPNTRNKNTKRKVVVKVISRQLNLIVMVTKKKLKRVATKVTPHHIVTTTKKKKQSQPKINSFVVDIYSPIVRIKEANNISKLKPVNTNRKTTTTDVSP